MDNNDNGYRNPNRKKVICPIQQKDGKTFWIRMGSAYVNRDNSINVYLDGLPVNGRLQIRDQDEPKKGEADGAGSSSAAPAAAANTEFPF